MNTEVLEQTREDLLLDLYQEMFPSVATYISNRGGSFEDARDLFHDAMIIFYEKFATLQIHMDERAYIMGIVKHLWTKKIYQTSRFTSLESLTEKQSETVAEPMVEKVLTFIQRAGQKCLDLLTAFYYHKNSMEEISTQFGFSGERSATVQKFKCLEKVRNSVKEKALNYDDFLE